MSENELSRQSVKISVDLVAEALPYMKRNGYKFQTLLLELFTQWLEEQKSGQRREAPASRQPIQEHKEDHELLDLVLRGQDEESKAAIRSTLAVFAKQTKGKKPHAVPKKETITRTVHHG